MPDLVPKKITYAPDASRMEREEKQKKKRKEKENKKPSLVPGDLEYKEFYNTGQISPSITRRPCNETGMIRCTMGRLPLSALPLRTTGCEATGWRWHRWRAGSAREEAQGLG